MAWTTPKTWVDQTLVTAADLNEQVRDNTSFLYTPPMCRVYRASAQTIGNASWTIVDTFAEDIDTDNMWDSPNNYIEIATPGVYRISFNIEFALNASGARLATVTLNNASATPSASGRLCSSFIPTNSVTNAGMSGTTLRSLSVGDKLRLTVYQTSGGNLNLTDPASGASPEITANWVGNI